MSINWKEAEHISKLKLPGSTIVYEISDSEARGVIDTLKSAAFVDTTAAISGSSNLPTDLAVKTYVDASISSEASTRATADSGLDKRISALEARGRYLSTWDASTGLPGDYPTVPSGQTSYTYEYKAGDYYIINNVPASGTAYMPNGASISTTDGGSTWTVGKTAYTESATKPLVIGGQFLYSTSSWKYVATAKDVAWGNITGDISQQTDLGDALAKKLDKAVASVAGVTFGTDQAITDAELKTALGLKNLAYSNTASGTINIKAVTVSSQTATGTPLVNMTGSLGGESTAITSTCSYTPVGTNASSEVTISSTSATVVASVEYNDENERLTFSTANVVGTIDSASAAAQTFTGSAEVISVSGNYVKTTIGTLGVSGSSSTFNVSSVNVPAYNITVTVSPD